VILCFDPVGLIERMRPVVHPCRVTIFRKAVSAVMDDLEKCYLIIDNFHPLSAN
jgi:hypothetical protein